MQTCLRCRRKALEAAGRQIASEVRQACTTYLVRCRQAELYEAGGLLSEAEAIFNSLVAFVELERACGQYSEQ